MKVIFNRLYESSLLACFYCKRKILLINIMKIIKSTVGIVRPYNETVQKNNVFRWKRKTLVKYIIKQLS